MALSWKNITVARTNCGADVFGLAGFLCDDDLICHNDPLGRMYSSTTCVEHIMNMSKPNPHWPSVASRPIQSNINLCIYINLSLIFAMML
jgi:hypothetical protein